MYTNLKKKYKIQINAGWGQIEFAIINGGKVKDYIWMQNNHDNYALKQVLTGKL